MSYAFIELATCANNNDVLIYNKTQDGWDLSATLSEVSNNTRYSTYIDTADLSMMHLSTCLVARQAHHRHLLGPSYQPDRHLFSRP
jgi:hypothetical protein